MIYATGTSNHKNDRLQKNIKQCEDSFVYFMDRRVMTIKYFIYIIIYIIVAIALNFLSTTRPTA